MKAVSLVLAVTLAASFGATKASQVYRCEASGKIEFRDQPCVDGTAKKITVRPNSVGEVDQSDAKAKGRALERQTRARLAGDEAYREGRRAALQRHEDECQNYLDAAHRQTAWLWSFSLAARQSAATEIWIQRRKFEAAKCGSWR
ncbi:MAG: hypothetical protein ACRD9W_05155 [Terriglobia bacterium]